MQKSVMAHLLPRLQTLSQLQTTDCQLLEGFLANRNETCFAELVRRHGPMVLGVCRRIVGTLHDAEEAFQATFFLLARKAQTIVPRETIGPWLHGVACRVAMKTRTMNRRRLFHERKSVRYRHEYSSDTTPLFDLRSILDQELQRLPTLYRTLVILCDLQGGTFRQVARQLNLPVGTLSGRLKRGRELLAERLSRRGITLSASMLILSLTEYARAQLPITLISSTMQAVGKWCITPPILSVVIPNGLKTMMKGTAVTMMMHKFKLVSCVSALVVMITASWLLYSSSASVAEDDPVAIPAGNFPALPLAQEKPAPQFILQLHVFEQGAGNDLEIVCSPMLIAHAHAKAMIQTNQLQQLKGNKVVPDLHQIGFEAELEVQPQLNGTIILQMKAERHKVRKATSELFATQTYSEKYVKSCQLNETIELPWEPFGNKGKLSVQVLQIAVPGELAPKSDATSLVEYRVIPLANQDAMQVAQSVEQHFSKKVTVQRRTNSLLVQGNKAEIKRITDFIKHMDMPQATGIGDSKQILQLTVGESFNLQAAQEAARKINDVKPSVEISLDVRKRELVIKILTNELQISELKSILEAGR